jgi:hypothetical protein
MADVRREIGRGGRSESRIRGQPSLPYRAFMSEKGTNPTQLAGTIAPVEEPPTSLL